ncbi:short transient receptor potential channel 4-associated protein-like isoform X1 [Branchiostoma floridae x Branchiostoma belcheri]
MFGGRKTTPTFSRHQRRRRAGTLGFPEGACARLKYLPEGHQNVVRQVELAKCTGRGLTRAIQLSAAFVEAVNSQQKLKDLPQIVRKLSQFTIGPWMDYHTICRLLKELRELLTAHGFEDNPGVRWSNTTRAFNTEVFDVFDGSQVVIELLMKPMLYPSEDKSAREQEKVQRMQNLCLEILHHVFANVGIIAQERGEPLDLVHYLFSLMAQQRTFLNAATVLEDMLQVKKDMIRLENIPNFPELVNKFNQQQLANFCRVVSVAMSELSESEDQLTLLYQDEAAKRLSTVPIPDCNQEILVALPDFIQRLVDLACRKLDEEQVSLPSMMNELESWMTWMDSSLAFDALFEILENQDLAYEFLDDPFGPIQVPMAMKAMREIMYKVEVLYVLCILITGKQRNKVQELMAKYKLIPRLNELYEDLIWKCNIRRRVHGEACECSPEIALKIQFLRLSHSFCDHHGNKYLMMSESELNELGRIRAQAELPAVPEVSDIDRELVCKGEKGLLSKIIQTMKTEKPTSPFRFWLCRAVESFLRGVTCFVDQIWLLRRGLLEHVLSVIIDPDCDNKEILQSSFDLLGELMKFNYNSFKRFSRYMDTEEKFQRFLKQVSSHLVDSNMFIRSVVLSQEHFVTKQTEYSEFATTQCRLLIHVGEPKNRTKFLCSLINIIQVSTLTQENVSCLNTALVILMFARRCGSLPLYLQSLREEEMRGYHPGFLLNNFRSLLRFWESHYLRNDKECCALEKVVKSSGISLDYWRETTLTMRGSDRTNAESIVHYIDEPYVEEL